MRSVVARSMRDLWRSVAGWSVAITAASALILYYFPTIQDFPHLDELFRSLPPPLQALSGGPEAVGSVTGFLKIKVIENLPLLFSIFALVHAADIVAGEEERGTLELLLAHPVARWEILLGKFVVVVLGVACMASAVAVGLVLTVTWVDMSVRPSWVFASVLGAVPVATIFGGVALLASSILRHARSATAWAGSLLGISYLLHFIAAASPSPAVWARLSPVHEYLRQIPWNGEVPVSVAWGPATLSFALVAAAVIGFARRDVGG